MKIRNLALMKRFLIMAATIIAIFVIAITFYIGLVIVSMFITILTGAT